jgi:cytochrome P450
MDNALRIVPPGIVPPAKPLGRVAFISRFVRNPLSVVPQAAYEQDVVASLRGRRPIIWVTAPALIRTILLDEREKFQKLSQIRLLSPLLGKGILTSEGADWKWQRQASAPMFRHQDLMTFVPTFVRTTEALIQRWRAAPNGGVQLIEREMTGVTFDVISATLLPSGDKTVAPAVELATGASSAPVRGVSSTRSPACRNGFRNPGAARRRARCASCANRSLRCCASGAPQARRATTCCIA